MRGAPLRQVVLLGAELNAEIEHQTAQDSTVGGDKPTSGENYPGINISRLLRADGGG